MLPFLMPMCAWHVVCACRLLCVAYCVVNCNHLSLEQGPFVHLQAVHPDCVAGWASMQAKGCSTHQHLRRLCKARIRAWLMQLHHSLPSTVMEMRYSGPSSQRHSSSPLFCAAFWTSAQLTMLCGVLLLSACACADKLLGLPDHAAL